MKTIVMKVDVDTYRGTRQGLRPLMNLFKKYNARATFLVSLGPDHTGWALKRIFRPGFFQKVQRTSVVANYGIKTLLYGVLLPAPHIGRQCKSELKEIEQNGFEAGIHCYDHVYWQDNVMQKSKEWTLQQLNLSQQAFKEVFNHASPTHGAAGWQMNTFGYDWLEQFKYSSDTRGSTPFFPLDSGGKKHRCLQMPTTLPTMDELMGLEKINEDTIADVLLEKTKAETQWGHVYTLHAELEGLRWIQSFEKFLKGLKSQNYQIISMGNYYQALMDQLEKIPSQPIIEKEISGRSGLVSHQGT